MTSPPYQKLITGYGNLFGENLKIKCDYGWGNILYDMCLSLEYLINTNEEECYKNFKIYKIESLYGVLNVECDYIDEHLKKIIDFAQRLSYHTCETCGNKGKIYCSSKWLLWSRYKTLCKEHAIKYLYYEIRNPKGKI